MIYKRIIKRAVDTLLASLGTLVILIPMGIIAIAIKLDSRGPVIFKQKREGENRKAFNVYKFRTMCDHAYVIGGIAKNSDDSRITKVGAFLRRTSLDEIPQFFNIIKGDMSIIGPRPILDWEFDEYAENQEYHKRFAVLPGMFCTVDLDLRAQASRDVQFKMDAEYAEHITFKSDVKAFFGIIKTVVSGKNVYKEYTNKEENEHGLHV